MNDKTVRLGFCLTGSFCTFEAALRQMARCRELGYELVPVFSYHAATLDTRFGKAEDFLRRAAEIAGRPVITTIQEAEPIGPGGLTDLMLVAPCTGNTLAKLNLAITDTPVTMAVKSHLRRGRPVILAVSTNDALKGTARNLGGLLAREHFYFVPFRQDAPNGKPASLVADFQQIPETLEAALAGRQIQPVMLGPAS